MDYIPDAPPVLPVSNSRGLGCLDQESAVDVGVIACVSSSSRLSAGRAGARYVPRKSLLLGLESYVVFLLAQGFRW